MLALSNPDIPLPTALMDAPGGFLWWYVDLVDERGNGIVLIWSFGLPFLPRLGGEARRGRPQTPRSRPSVNISVYREGKLDFYLLQELEPGEVGWKPGEGSELWLFGLSRMHLTRADGRTRLTVDLDLALPDTSDRLVGTVRLDGPRLRQEASREDGAHQWTPMVGPARGQAALRAGGWRCDIDGDAYFDRNGGDRPLHDLGIREWTWGRATVGGVQWIYYLVEPEVAGEPPVATVLRIDADGSVTRTDGVETRTYGTRPSTFGPRWSPRMTLHHEGETLLEVSQATPVDSGPFYLRLPLLMTDAEGRSGRGWGEFVLPNRIDLVRHRFFVQMRVHRPGGRSSMWLPLFTGPSRGRLRRLLAGGDVHLPPGADVARADEAAS